MLLHPGPCSIARVGAGSGLLVWSACLGCSSGSTGADGAGGSGGTLAVSDGRYVIEDVQEECDDVPGLRAAAVLEATGLTYDGTFSWSDLETGYEASRTTVHVRVDIQSGGTITCFPFRHLPGQAPTFARLSYDGASMSMSTDDGLLAESGFAVMWLAETQTAGVLTLDAVRALPGASASGTLEVSPILGDSYGTLALVFAPSETMPLGHVSFATESATSLLESGDVTAGVTHGYFPALP